MKHKINRVASTKVLTFLNVLFHIKHVVSSYTYFLPEKGILTKRVSTSRKLLKEADEHLNFYTKDQLIISVTKEKSNGKLSKCQREATNLRNTRGYRYPSRHTKI